MPYPSQCAKFRQACRPLLGSLTCSASSYTKVWRNNRLASFQREYTQCQICSVHHGGEGGGAVYPYVCLILFRLRIATIGLPTCCEIDIGFVMVSLFL